MELFNKIGGSKLIITDNWLGMILSVITRTSCIILEKDNEILKSEYNKWFKELDYIEFINNYEELKQKLILLKNKTIHNTYNAGKYNKYFERIKKYFE